MGLIVPNPSVPTDGQPVEATTLAANLNAVYQAIQSFDASQVASGTLSAGAFAASINPNTILHDTLSSFVYSGCVWTSVSGLVGTMSSGVAYIANATGMFRVSVSSVGSNTFTASKDTYIDIDYNGNITYNAVSNGASAPALTANSIRIAKVVTNGSAITSVTQTGIDSNNVQIYPTNPYGYGNSKSWTPTWTNVTVGNGTVNAAYSQIGKNVYFYLEFTLGSTSSVGGLISFSLPVTSISYPGTATLQIIGNGTAYNGTNVFWLQAAWASTTTANLTVANAASTYLLFANTSGTVPFTWGSTNQLFIKGVYEAA